MQDSFDFKAQSVDTIKNNTASASIFLISQSNMNSERPSSIISEDKEGRAERTNEVVKRRFTTIM